MKKVIAFPFKVVVTILLVTALGIAVTVGIMLNGFKATSEKVDRAAAVLKGFNI